MIILGSGFEDGALKIVLCTISLPELIFTFSKSMKSPGRFRHDPVFQVRFFCEAGIYNLERCAFRFNYVISHRISKEIAIIKDYFKTSPFEANFSLQKFNAVSNY